MCIFSQFFGEKYFKNYRVGPWSFSEDYRWETVSVPKPGPNEILVKVAAVGICAGDAKCFAGADRFWGSLRFGGILKTVLSGFEIKKMLKFK
jgi:hypothetical protein